MIGKFASSESGALSLSLLILVPALFLVGGLATDISQLNAQKSYAQGQADLAAQSAALQLPDIDAARDVARRVVDANDQYGETDADVVFGHFSRVAGFQPSVDQSAPRGVNAVEVRVHQPWKTFLLAPVIQSQAHVITRHAIASRKPAVVSFTLRNTLLSVDTNESALLNPLLDGLLGVDGLGLDVDVLRYDALADADVSLNALLDRALDIEAEVLTYGEVLDAALPISALLDGLAGLGGLPAAALAGGGASGPNIAFGDLLTLSPDLEALYVGDVLPDITVNALDLLTVAAGLAGGDPSERLSLDTGVDLSPIANVGLEVGLPQGPVTFIASPADDPPLIARITRLGVDLEAGAGGLLGVGASLSAADATAQLIELNCQAAAGADILARFEVMTAPASLALQVDLLSAIDGKDYRQPPLATPVAGTTRIVEVRRDQLGQPVLVPGTISLAALSGSVSSILGGLRSDLQDDKEAKEQERRDRCRSNPIGCLLGGIVGLLDGLIGLLTNVLDEVTGLLAQTLFLDGLAESLLTLLGIDTAPAELIVNSYSCGSDAGVALVR